MSGDSDRDEAIVKLQYLNLRTNLLNGLTNLTHEFITLSDTMDDSKKWSTQALDRTMNLMADKKSYLLDIAKQGLTSEDYAHFKDLTDNHIISYWEQKGFEKKKTKTF